MKLKEIIAETLEIATEDVTDDLSPAVCSAWTSKTHLILIKKVMNAYDIKIPLKEILQIHNVKDLCTALDEKGVSYDWT